MTYTISRRQVLGVLAAPIVAGCRGLDLVGPTFSSAASSAANGAVTLIGAGDQHAVTSLQRVHREKTAAMVKSALEADPTAWAFSAGDLTHKGSELELQAYDSSWGQFRNRTLFTLGNHDRMTDPTAAPYYEYTRAERYYARDLGDRWRCYVLNCESPWNGGANPNEQTAWLKADLAQHPNRHILAMWHYPLYSNVCAHAGKEMTWPGRVGPWWQVLQEQGAELLVVGHVHRWERFSPILRTGLRTGVVSGQGIRQFVAGGGGGNPYGILKAHPHCQKTVVARGVARFDLYPDRYTWKFTDVAGAVRDSGTQMCRKVISG